MEKKFVVAEKTVTYRNNGKKRVMTLNEEGPKTDQQFKNDCDINYIVKKFNPQIHMAKSPGIYADTTEIPDLLTASNIVKDAETKFMQLPADARLKFNNNPIEMINFLKNPQNQEEAIQMGLMIKREVRVKNDKLNDENHQKPTKTQQKAKKADDSQNSDQE